MNDIPARRRTPVASAPLPQEAAELVPPSVPANNVLTSGELGEFAKAAVKLHGAEVIRAAELMPKFKHVPTNIFALDLALHGGIPEGCVTLVYGRASSGKSTLSLRVIGQAQKKYPDKAAVLIDLEGTYEPSWAEAHGIDNSKLLLIQPQSGEQALDLALGAVRAKETSCIVVDSLAALVPMKEIEKSMEDLTVGEQAKMIARFCRVVTAALNKERARGHRPILILINQWRQKIGVMFGDPRVLPGGEAQHYAATIKIEMKNKEVMGKNEKGREVVAHNVHSFKIDKSKIGAGIREGEFKMIRDNANYLGAGFMDEAQTVVAWARSQGLITGGGSSWTVAGVDTKFSRLQDIADYFYSDDAFYEAFKQNLIRLNRIDADLPEEFL